MANLKTILTAVSLALVSSTGYADSPAPPIPTPTPPSPVIIPITKPEDPIKDPRPKAPSAQYIECMYSDGELTFSFAIPEGDCSLALTDEAGFTAHYYFDSSELSSIYVGDLTFAFIEISTAAGNYYIGYLE